MEAEEHYKTGINLKTQGQTDLALTSFRRAVIADPAHVASHIEIGQLCRAKSKSDKMFLRYAFEAFQKAARLDVNNEPAHTYYVTLGQQMGVLDTLLDEYSGLSKKFPDNALLQRCHKNVIALTMAMIPQQVNVSGASASGGMRKLALIGSLALLLMGIGFMVAPPILLKKGKLAKNQVAGMMRLGLLFEGLGIAGLVLRTRLN